VVQVIREAIKLWIKQGVLTRGQAIVYFDKYLEVFGRDKVEVEYLRIATTLLSHPYYGAEATTKGFWNGGLIFKGETYKNTQLLYETITDILGGDPFDSIEWFNELLGWVLADPTKMAADAYLGGDNFSAYANYCRRVVKAAKEPIKISDISEFTGEDAAFLATFLGVF
jgi:hypothetical protein